MLPILCINLIIADKRSDGITMASTHLIAAVIWDIYYRLPAFFRDTDESWWAEAAWIPRPVRRDGTIYSCQEDEIRMHDHIYSLLWEQSRSIVCIRRQ